MENLPLERVNVEVFKEIDSTNDEAKRINIEKEFHIIVSDKQTNGRGRKGKTWSSPNSGNIYMTICTNKDISLKPISLISGLICKKAIDQLLDKPIIMLKWPNDILLKNKKIGGILVETESKGLNIKTIVGIGINLNIKKEQSWWGDLSEFKLDEERNKLINLILLNFISAIDNLDAKWLDQWKNSCVHINKEVEIYDGERFVKTAIFKDIDNQGNAIIETKNGHEKIISGEISIKGIY